MPKRRRRYLVKANLENKNMIGRNLDGADLRKANLRGALLSNASFKPVKKTTRKGGSVFIIGFLIFDLLGQRSSQNSSNRIVRELFADKTTVICANFAEADLSEADLENAKLSEANFYKAQMKNTNLSGALMPFANLTEAVLTGANFTNADMENALLCKANLEGADFTGANLSGVDFENANLKNAILYGVDLSDVDYLETADLTGAELAHATLPKGFSFGPKPPPEKTKPISFLDLF